MSRRRGDSTADVTSAVLKAVSDDSKSASRSVNQLGSLLSILAVQDVYDAVRPLLIREKILGEKDDARVVRPDLLKALARKWNLHKEGNFWRENDTPLKLAISLLEHEEKIARYRRGHAASPAPGKVGDSTADSDEDVGSERGGLPGRDDSVGTSVLAHKQSIWSKMATQQREADPKATTVRRSKSAAHTSRTPTAPGRDGGGGAAAPSSSAKALRASFKPYMGDLFSQRGDYSKALLYLSRMPAATGGSGGETVFTRMGNSVGFRRIRRCTSELDDNLMAGIEEDWKSVAVRKDAGAPPLSKLHVAMGATTPPAPLPLSIGGLTIQLSDTGAIIGANRSVGRALAFDSSAASQGLASVSVPGEDVGGAEISALLGKPPAGSASAAVAALGSARALSRGGSVTFADVSSSRSTGLIRSGASVGPGSSGSVRSAVTASVTGLLHSTSTGMSATLGGQEGEEEGEDGRVSPSAGSVDGNGRTGALLDAEAIETALSRGAHATTDFTLQLIESATGKRLADADGEGTIPPPQPVKLSLRQQCALALREMSRDVSARGAIVAQGGFRALLQVLLESEAGAAAEADFAVEFSAAASARDESIAGDQHGGGEGMSLTARSVAMSGTGHSGGGGAVSALNTSHNQSTAYLPAPPQGTTIQPMTDTVMNCLVAICNLSTVLIPDHRQVFDEPQSTSSPMDAAVPSALEPGLISALSALAPSVNGAARVILLTTLYNLSCNRYLREQLVEEGAVGAALALCTPEVVHMKGMLGVPLAQAQWHEKLAAGARSNANTASSSQGSVSGGGSGGDASTSNFPQKAPRGTVDGYSVDSDQEGDGEGVGEESERGGISDDDISTAINAVGTMAAHSNPAGTHVRSRILQLLRRLARLSINKTRSPQAGATRGVGEVDVKSPSPVPPLATSKPLLTVDATSDACLLLEDAYCLDVGTRLLCNFSGFPNGAEALLRMNAISTLSSQWQWLSHNQRCLIAGHVLYNTTRTKLNARAAAEGNAATMLNAVIEDILRITHAQPALSATHDFVLRRATLALARLTLNPQACEYLLWSEGARVLATASLHIGTKRVVGDDVIIDSIRRAASGVAVGGDETVVVMPPSASTTQPTLVQEQLLEIHDLAATDAGDAVGHHPAEKLYDRLAARNPDGGLGSEGGSSSRGQAAAGGGTATANSSGGSSSSSARDGLPATRYPTILVQRKIAAALCRLAWGEPPSTAMLAASVAPSSGEGKSSSANSAFSAQSAAAAGGWEKPTSLSSGQVSAPAVDGSTGLPLPVPDRRLGPDSSISFDSALQLDKDRERQKRVTVYVGQRNVLPALFRLLFVPDGATRKIAHTALCTVMRVPAACAKAVASGALGALALSAQMANASGNMDFALWTPHQLPDADQRAVLHAYANDHSSIAMALYNASCHVPVRRMLLKLRVSDITLEGNRSASAASSTAPGPRGSLASGSGVEGGVAAGGSGDVEDNEDEDASPHDASARTQHEGSSARASGTSSGGRLHQSWMVRSSQAATPLPSLDEEALFRLAAYGDVSVERRAPLAWGSPNDTTCIQTDAGIKRASLLAVQTATAVQMEADTLLALVQRAKGNVKELTEASQTERSATAQGTTEASTVATDLPVVHALLLIMSHAVSVVNSATADEAFADPKVGELLGLRASTSAPPPPALGKASKAGAHKARAADVVLVPSPSAEYVAAATALSFALAALRNITAESGYQSRVLASGIVPTLMTVLTPRKYPGRSGSWCPFPLPCISDAVHILANLSIDIVSRQVMLQSGLLPALLPIASDNGASILAQSLSGSVAQAKVDFVRQRETETKRTEDTKKNASMAAALNARTVVVVPVPEPNQRPELARFKPEAHRDGSAPPGARKPVLVADIPPITVAGDSLASQDPLSIRASAGSASSPFRVDSPIVGGDGKKADERGLSLMERRRRRSSIALPDAEALEAASSQPANSAILEALGDAEVHPTIVQRVQELVAAAADARRQCALALSAMAMAGAAQFADRLLELGVLQALVSLCYFGREGDELRDRITAALQALASEEHLAVELIKHGAIPALVSLCGSSSEKVRRQCVGALANLSRVRGYEQEMANCGVVPALMVIALLRSNDPATQSRCVFTVHNLLAEPTCRQMILQQGFVWALQKLALSHDIATQRAVAVCIFRLASDPTSQNLLVRQGGLRSVISVLHKAYGIKTTAAATEGTSDEKRDDSIIMTSLREAAIADAESKVGMTGVNTAPSQIGGSGVVGGGEKREGAGGGCDPVVASYFAGVLAAVSRVKGNESVLIAEGAVEALVVLCTASRTASLVSSGANSPTSYSPGSSPPPSPSAADSLEANDISKLRPSCALGLYNLSCAPSVELRARVIAGGAPGVFVHLAGSPDESAMTRRLSTLGLCNLIWGDGGGPDPLYFAHPGGGAAGEGVGEGMLPVATRASGRSSLATGGSNSTATAGASHHDGAPMSHRMAVVQAGFMKAVLGFATYGDASDWFVAVAAIHHLSCFEDCHEALVNEGVMECLLHFVGRVANFDPQAVVSEGNARMSGTGTAAAASHDATAKLAAMRMDLETASLAAAALANLCTQPLTAEKACFSLAYGGDALAALVPTGLSGDGAASGGTSARSFDPRPNKDNLRRLVEYCSLGCASVSTLMSAAVVWQYSIAVRDAALGADSTLKARGETSSTTGSSVIPNSPTSKYAADRARLSPFFDDLNCMAVVADVERASMLVDSVVAVLGALVHAPGITLAPISPDARPSGAGTAAVVVGNGSVGSSGASAMLGSRKAASKFPVKKTIPFPYVAALIASGAIECIHAIVAASQLPSLTDALPEPAKTTSSSRSATSHLPSSGNSSAPASGSRLSGGGARGTRGEPQSVRRMPSVRSFRGADVPAHTTDSSSSLPATTIPTSSPGTKATAAAASASAGGGSGPLVPIIGAPSIMLSPLPRKTVAGAITVLSVLLAVPAGCAAFLASLKATPADSEFSAAMFIKRLVALAVAAATPPGDNEDLDISSHVADSKEVDAIVNDMIKPTVVAGTDGRHAIVRLEIKQPGSGGGTIGTSGGSSEEVAGSSSSVTATAAPPSGASREARTPARPTGMVLNVARAQTSSPALNLMSPSAAATFDTQRMKAYADPSFAFTEQAAERVKQAIMAQFSAAVAQEIRDGCARCLCHLSAEAVLRETMVACSAPSALISLSKHADTAPHLQRACLRAICQLAIGIDSVAPTSGPAPAAYTSGGATARSATSTSTSVSGAEVAAPSASSVINSGAISALISVMETADMADVANAVGESAVAADPRDVLTEYLNFEGQDRSAWWGTLNPHDVALHPHAHVLWPLFPEAYARGGNAVARVIIGGAPTPKSPGGASGGGGTASSAPFAATSGLLGSDGEELALGPGLPHPTSLDLNRILELRRAAEAAEAAAVLSLSASREKRRVFQPANAQGGGVALLLSDPPRRCLYTPSLNPASRISLMPVAALYARAFALAQAVDGTRAHSTGSSGHLESSGDSDTFDADPLAGARRVASGGVRDLLGFVMGHHTFVTYDDAVTVHERIMSASTAVEREWRADPKRAAVAAAASAESAASYAVSLVRQASSGFGLSDAGSHTSSSKDSSSVSSSTTSLLTAVKLRPDSLPKPAPGSVVCIDGVDVIQGRKLLTVDVPAFISDVLKHPPKPGRPRTVARASLPMAVSIKVPTAEAATAMTQPIQQQQEDCPVLFALLLVPSIAPKAIVDAVFNASGNEEAEAPSTPPRGQSRVVAHSGATDNATGTIATSREAVDTGSGEATDDAAAASASGAVVAEGRWPKIGRAVAAIRGSDGRIWLSCDFLQSIEPSVHAAPIVPSRGRRRRSTAFFSASIAASLLTSSAHFQQQLASGGGGASKARSSSAYGADAASMSAVAAYQDLVTNPDAIHDGVGLDEGVDGDDTGLLTTLRGSQYATPATSGRGPGEVAAPGYAWLPDDEDTALVDGWGRRYGFDLSERVDWRVEDEREREELADRMAATRVGAPGTGTIAGASHGTSPTPGSSQPKVSPQHQSTVKQRRLSSADVGKLLSQIPAPATPKASVGATPPQKQAPPTGTQRGRRVSLAGMLESTRSSTGDVSAEAFVLSALETALRRSIRLRWETAFITQVDPEMWRAVVSDTSELVKHCDDVLARVAVRLLQLERKAPPHTHNSAVSSLLPNAGVITKLGPQERTAAGDEGCAPGSTVAVLQAVFPLASVQDGIKLLRTAVDTRVATPLMQFLPALGVVIAGAATHVATHGLYIDINERRLRALAPGTVRKVSLEDALLSNVDEDYSTAMPRESSVGKMVGGVTPARSLEVWGGAPTVNGNTVDHNKNQSTHYRLQSDSGLVPSDSMLQLASILNPPKPDAAMGGERRRNSLVLNIGGDAARRASYASVNAPPVPIRDTVGSGVGAVDASGSSSGPPSSSVLLVAKQPQRFVPLVPRVATLPSRPQTTPGKQPGVAAGEHSVAAGSSPYVVRAKRYKPATVTHDASSASVGADAATGTTAAPAPVKPPAKASHTASATGVLQKTGEPASPYSQRTYVAVRPLPVRHRHVIVGAGAGGTSFVPSPREADAPLVVTASAEAALAVPAPADHHDAGLPASAELVVAPFAEPVEHPAQ